MKLQSIILLFLLPIFGATAQSSRVLVQNAKVTAMTAPIVNVKWYNQQFVYKKGVNLYRRESGGAWVKLNSTPIVIAATVPPALLQRDEDLQMFVDMAKEIALKSSTSPKRVTLRGIKTCQ